MIYFVLFLSFQILHSMDNNEKFILNNQTAELYGFEIYSEVQDNMDIHSCSGLLNQMMNVDIPVKVGTEPSITLRLKPVDVVSDEHNVTYETCTFGNETIFQLTNIGKYAIEPSEKGIYLFNSATKTKILPIGFQESAT